MFISAISNVKVYENSLEDNEIKPNETNQQVLVQGFRSSLFEALFKSKVLTNNFELNESFSHVQMPPLTKEMEQALEDELTNCGFLDFFQQFFKQVNVIDQTVIRGNWLIYFLFQKFPHYRNEVLSQLKINGIDLSKWPLFFPHQTHLTIKSSVTVDDLAILTKLCQEFTSNCDLNIMVRPINTSDSTCICLFIDSKILWNLEIKSSRHSICVVDDLSIEITSILKKEKSTLTPFSPSSYGLLPFLHFMLGIYEVPNAKDITTGWDWQQWYGLSGIYRISNELAIKFLDLKIQSDQTFKSFIESTNRRGYTDDQKFILNFNLYPQLIKINIKTPIFSNFESLKNPLLLSINNLQLLPNEIRALLTILGEIRLLAEPSDLEFTQSTFHFFIPNVGMLSWESTQLQAPIDKKIDDEAIELLIHYFLPSDVIKKVSLKLLVPHLIQSETLGLKFLGLLVEFLSQPYSIKTRRDLSRLFPEIFFGLKSQDLKSLLISMACTYFKQIPKQSEEQEFNEEWGFCLLKGNKPDLSLDDLALIFWASSFGKKSFILKCNALIQTHPNLYLEVWNKGLQCLKDDLFLVCANTIDQLFSMPQDIQKTLLPSLITNYCSFIAKENWLSFSGKEKALIFKPLLQICQYLFNQSKDLFPQELLDFVKTSTNEELKDVRESLLKQQDLQKISKLKTTSEIEGFLKSLQNRFLEKSISKDAFKEIFSTLVSSTLLEKKALQKAIFCSIDQTSFVQVIELYYECLKASSPKNAFLFLIHFGALFHEELTDKAHLSKYYYLQILSQLPLLEKDTLDEKFKNDLLKCFGKAYTAILTFEEIEKFHTLLKKTFPPLKESLKELRNVAFSRYHSQLKELSTEKANHLWKLYRKIHSRAFWKFDQKLSFLELIIQKFQETEGSYLADPLEAYVELLNSCQVEMCTHSRIEFVINALKKVKKNAFSNETLRKINALIEKSLENNGIKESQWIFTAVDFGFTFQSQGFAKKWVALLLQSVDEVGVKKAFSAYLCIHQAAAKATDATLSNQCAELIYSILQKKALQPLSQEIKILSELNPYDLELKKKISSYLIENQGLKLLFKEGAHKIAQWADSQMLKECFISSLKEEIKKKTVDPIYPMIANEVLKKLIESDKEFSQEISPLLTKFIEELFSKIIERAQGKLLIKKKSSTEEESSLLKGGALPQNLLHKAESILFDYPSCFDHALFLQLLEITVLLKDESGIARVWENMQTLNLPPFKESTACYSLLLEIAKAVTWLNEDLVFKLIQGIDFLNWFKKNLDVGTSFYVLLFLNSDKWLASDKKSHAFYLILKRFNEFCWQIPRTPYLRMIPRKENFEKVNSEGRVFYRFPLNRTLSEINKNYQECLDCDEIAIAPFDANQRALHFDLIKIEIIRSDFLTNNHTNALLLLDDFFKEPHPYEASQLFCLLFHLLTNELKYFTEQESINDLYLKSLFYLLSQYIFSPFKLENEKLILFFENVFGFVRRLEKLNQGLFSVILLNFYNKSTKELKNSLGKSLNRKIIIELGKLIEESTRNDKEIFLLMLIPYFEEHTFPKNWSNPDYFLLKYYTYRVWNLFLSKGNANSPEEKGLCRQDILTDISSMKEMIRCSIKHLQFTEMLAEFIRVVSRLIHLKKFTGTENSISSFVINIFYCFGSDEISLLRKTEACIFLDKLINDFKIEKFQEVEIQNLVSFANSTAEKLNGIVTSNKLVGVNIKILNLQTLMRKIRGDSKPKDPEVQNLLKELGDQRTHLKSHIPDKIEESDSDIFVNYFNVIFNAHIKLNELSIPGMKKRSVSLWEEIKNLKQIPDEFFVILKSRILWNLLKKLRKSNCNSETFNNYLPWIQESLRDIYTEENKTIYNNLLLTVFLEKIKHVPKQTISKTLYQEIAFKIKEFISLLNDEKIDRTYVGYFTETLGQTIVTLGIPKSDFSEEIFGFLKSYWNEINKEFSKIEEKIFYCKVKYTLLIYLSNFIKIESNFQLKARYNFFFFEEGAKLLVNKLTSRAEIKETFDKFLKLYNQKNKEIENLNKNN